MIYPRINLRTIKRTSHVCPSEWEGALKDGRPFYARFRMNHFQFWIARDPKLFQKFSDHQQMMDYFSIYCRDIGYRLINIENVTSEQYAGYMPDSEFLTILHKYSLVDYYSCVIMYLRVKEVLERLFYRVRDVYYKGNTGS